MCQKLNVEYGGRDGGGCGSVGLGLCVCMVGGVYVGVCEKRLMGYGVLGTGWREAWIPWSKARDRFWRNASMCTRWAKIVLTLGAT